VFTLSVLYAHGSLRFGQFVVASPDFVLGLLFAVAFLQVHAIRRLPASFVEPSSLFGDQSEA
jgi:hypothetical protein